MDAYRVEIFHAAHGDDVALPIPHHFKLDFLPPGNALFNEHLSDRGKAQAVQRDFMQLLGRFGNTAAAAAEGEGRADDDRIPDLLRKGHCRFHIVYHL